MLVCVCVLVMADTSQSTLTHVATDTKPARALSGTTLYYEHMYVSKGK